MLLLELCLYGTTEVSQINIHNPHLLFPWYMTDANLLWMWSGARSIIPHPSLLLPMNKCDLGQVWVFSPLNYSFTGQQNSSHLLSADSPWFH